MKRWLPIYVWALSYLRPYWRRTTVYLLLGLGIAAGEMAVPKAIQYVIDDVIMGRQLDLFIMILGMLLLLFVLVIAMQAGKNILERYVTEYVSRDMQLSIFRKLRQLGFPYYEQHSVGESLSLMNTEVAAVQRMYRDQLPGLLQATIEVAVVACLLFWMHAPFVMVALPCFAVYWFVGPILEKKNMHAILQLTENRVELNKKLFDSMSALTELRANGKEQWDLSRIFERLARFNESWSKDHIYSWVRGVPRRIVVYGSAIAVFSYGALLVQHGTLSVGQFAAFAIFYMRMVFRITFMITCTTEIRLLMAQAEKLYKLLQQAPEVQQTVQPLLLNHISGQLSFQNVSFGYPSRPQVITSFSLEIKSGERIALVGESGSGKTTLLKLIGRFYDPTAGDIELDGVPLRRITLEQLRSAVGFVFQETYLFGTSIRDNIRFGRPEATDQEVEQAAAAAFIHDFIAQLPDGYNTEVGERGYKLSGGQKQRVAIARMLLKNPSVVVLDEATAALDNVSEKHVQRALEALLRGRTTITVAHRLSTIRDYDRIVVMNQGTITEIGSYDELMKSRGALYRLSEGRADAVG